MSSSGKFDTDTIKVLNAMSEMTKPASGKEIASASGVEATVIGKKIQILKSAGLVDTPVRCKYAITDAGKKEIC